MSLTGKTLFVTGASRGIGLAIALRAARDGANIVIAAKTADPHAKLPGTIYTAAEEIEAAGGKGAAAGGGRARRGLGAWRGGGQAVEAFGGIDICVNNASAISLTGDAGDRHEALRPDAPGQRARDLPDLQGLPPAPEEGGQSARPDAVAAAGHAARAGSAATSPTRWPSTA